MENPKNQREVENRLREALHHDRARVQTGKISRFGLMELSRQRLQPSLEETSHIACPRCHGTGFIRGIESSALHILRIMQEEAMKESTGAIHAQVPVDVATFLLNEKRAELFAIEARLKVSAVLIPNIHLETPNYSITRLRHDDLNSVEELRPSYRMVEAPPEEGYQPHQAREEQARRPEAAVKGITPAQPAPVSAPREAEAVVAPTAAPTLSVWTRIANWFKGEPAIAETPAQAETKRAQPAGNRPQRNGRDGQPQGQGQNGNRGRNERGGRNNNERGENKGPRSEREERTERTQGEQPRRNNGGGKPRIEEDISARAARNEQRNERNRGERGERGERPERAERADRGERAERPERNERPAEAVAGTQEPRAPRNERPPRQERAPKPVLEEKRSASRCRNRNRRGNG